MISDKSNLPIPRAEIKRQKQVGNGAARVQVPIAPNSIVPTARAASSLLLLLVGLVVLRGNCSGPRLLPPRH